MLLDNAEVIQRDRNSLFIAGLAANDQTFGVKRSRVVIVTAIEGDIAEIAQGSG